LSERRPDHGGLRLGAPGRRADGPHGRAARRHFYGQRPIDRGLATIGAGFGAILRFVGTLSGPLGIYSGDRMPGFEVFASTRQYRGAVTGRVGANASS